MHCGTLSALEYESPNPDLMYAPGNIACTGKLKVPTMRGIYLYIYILVCTGEQCMHWMQMGVKGVIF